MVPNQFLSTIIEKVKKNIFICCKRFKKNRICFIFEAEISLKDYLAPKC